MPPNLCVVLQQVSCTEKQVIEIHPVCRPFFCAKPVGGHFHNSRQSLGGSDSCNLTDLRKKSRRVIPFPQRMPCLLRIEFVGQFTDGLEISAVFSDVGCQSGFNFGSGNALSLYSTFNP